jgi:hypothetical protein
MTIETTCAVIIPEGYASVEAYLAAHEQSKKRASTKRGATFAAIRLGGNKPRKHPEQVASQQIPEACRAPAQGACPADPGFGSHRSRHV